MQPLPGTGELYLWRLDRREHADGWDSGIGAELAGGRWNSKGVRAVYASADAATAILEVAVHKGFPALDRVPHVLTCARILDPARVLRVEPGSLPNRNWLVPGIPSHGQQVFGNELLAAHPFILIPSAVVPHGWNLLLSPALAKGAYELVSQEAFALDTRLNPPVP
ncbi:RES family NAD+ phosphorylase [Pseudomonas citronellolis]|uniref:RES family NAD+ phosphorylase n=1 Tax=Pseudomonas citronellolis TaxID=53408 RepID=UPI00209D76EF|nr:RES domain-containing protein [Pseudomonas citronellolis]MCP1603937.1 RES domain-containing protein [Pseudomonas citronellolis]MCP1654413.1 RES domain-containing protein [Pseudomonas citronellolis]MCP1721595.1 RES domain-containing protein [Pseudomonas citronellolis]